MFCLIVFIILVISRLGFEGGILIAPVPGHCILVTSSHLLWPYSPVCVGPGGKPKDRFSRDEAQM